MELERQWVESKLRQCTWPLNWQMAWQGTAAAAEERTRVQAAASSTFWESWSSFLIWRSKSETALLTAADDLLAAPRPFVRLAGTDWTGTAPAREGCAWRTVRPIPSDAFLLDPQVKTRAAGAAAARVTPAGEVVHDAILRRGSCGRAVMLD